MSVNNYDMNWDVISESFESNGPKVNFMRLQDGQSRIRVGSMPSKVSQHWEKTVSGKSRKITCIGKDCPLCKLGHQPTTRYQLKILDKIDSDQPVPKILEVGVSVIKQISNCAKDPEFGDPTTYDLKITKQGVGKETRYTVMASPKKYELTEAEINMLNNLPSIRDINKELTPDEIRALPLACFANDDISRNNDDNFSSPNPSGKDKSAAASDWDELD